MKTITPTTSTHYESVYGYGPEQMSGNTKIAVTSDVEFPANSNATLMKTRLLLDQQYVQSWHAGRRMRKKP